MTDERAALYDAIVELMDALADGGRDEGARTLLLDRVLDYQRRTVAPYARLSRQHGVPDNAAVPTDVFRFARVASHDPEQDVRVFRTSGTTSGARGAHHLCDLSLYDRAAKYAARYALFPDRKRLQLLILAPTAAQAPDSSLAYMLQQFIPWFGDHDSMHVWQGDAIAGGPDIPTLRDQLQQAQQARRPVALLGTSFAFVHVEDALGTRRFSLPPGSRVMQTGGFKGRSRTLQPEEMLRTLSERYDIPEPFIVQEYGMTELSSQLYENTLRAALLGEPARERRLWAPGWVQAQPVDPDSLRPIASGGRGLLRIEDLANLDSVCAIQTADLAVRDTHGLRLLGRAPEAMARGCSLAVEEALGKRK